MGKSYIRSFRRDRMGAGHQTRNKAPFPKRLLHFWRYGSLPYIYSSYKGREGAQLWQLTPRCNLSRIFRGKHHGQGSLPSIRTR